MPPVLLVDDDPSTLALLGHILGSKGYRILPAATGTEALEASAMYQGPIPLLLFITAYRKQFDVSSAALVEKPSTPEQLLARIEQVLSAPESVTPEKPNGPTVTA